MIKDLPKYQKKRAAHKNSVKRYEKNIAASNSKIEDIVLTGEVENHSSRITSVHLQLKSWELVRLNGSINRNGLYHERVLEQTFIVTKRLNKTLCETTFSTLYFTSSHSNYTMFMRPKRFPKAGYASIGLYNFFLLSLALLLDKKTEFGHLYSQFKKLYEVGAIIRSRSHIADLVLALCANAQGQALNRLVENFAYQDIVDNWNTSDVQQVAKWLEQVCDDQVNQVCAKYDDFYCEFNNGNWQFIPFAALTLLKLRQNAGLPNPSFEHELFLSPVEDMLLQDETPVPMDTQSVEKGIKFLHELGFSIDQVMALCD